MSIIVSTVSYRIALPTFLLVSVFVATCKYTDRGFVRATLNMWGLKSKQYFFQFQPAQECHSLLHWSRHHPCLKFAVVSISAPKKKKKQQSCQMWFTLLLLTSRSLLAAIFSQQPIIGSNSMHLWSRQPAEIHTKCENEEEITINLLSGASQAEYFSNCSTQISPHKLPKDLQRKIFFKLKIQWAAIL